MYVTEIKEKQIFPSHTPEVYSNHYTVCMFYCIGDNSICLLLHKLETDNVLHTSISLNFLIFMIESLQVFREKMKDSM